MYSNFFYIKYVAWSNTAHMAKGYNIVQRTFEIDMPVANILYYVNLFFDPGCE